MNAQHYFIDCTYFRPFWNFLIEHFKKVGIENNMKKFKYIMIGYKIRDSNYKELNILLNVIGYTIYKVYHISEQKVKTVNVISIFKNELITYRRCKHTQLGNHGLVAP